LSAAEIAQIKSTTMRELMLRHYDLADVIGDEAFRPVTMWDGAA